MNAALSCQPSYGRAGGRAECAHHTTCKKASLNADKHAHMFVIKLDACITYAQGRVWANAFAEVSLLAYPVTCLLDAYDLDVQKHRHHWHCTNGHEHSGMRNDSLRLPL